MGKDRSRVLSQVDLCTESALASALWLIGADGARLAVDGDSRRALRERFTAGELDEVIFEAGVFVARYPNRNYLRFRDEDLEAFAASFAGQPFLRDHNSYELDARGGTVRDSRLEGREIVQRIALTVPRDIEAFLNQTIDRFSISWYWTPPLCSVCGNEWLSRDCAHWPGRKYGLGDAGKKEALCELIFVAPVGKETSAVNAPAVGGTGVRTTVTSHRGAGGVLAELMAAKEEFEEGRGMDQEENTLAVSAAGTVTPDTLSVRGTGAPVAQAASAVNASEVAALLEAQRAVVLDARLAGSGLPGALQDAVRAILPADWTVAKLDGLIETQRTAWAALEAARTVQGHGMPRDGRATGMITGLDQVTEALTALIEGRAPKSGTRPLSGLREAYLLLSGDYNMVGMFQPDNVGLAAVDSSTMAGIVANAMNKVIVNEFQKYPRWWEPFVDIQNFTNMQTVRWVTLGGIGELPTVSEGAAYTELAWDDQTETSSWVKKGGYLGLSLEAMDKDDVSRLRTAPRALAQAAWLSLGKAVARIFTINSGVGPPMSDSKALFHTDHGNLGTTAFSSTSWAAARLAMRKQAELNSGERLGALTAPKYVLVPPDLEQTALTVLGSEGLPGTANNDVNTEAQGDTHDARMAAARRRIIVVDLWSDATDWAAVSDPLMYPSIGLGYRFGETPEIFSVASPNQGLMFSNDVLPIKVRYFFAVGPTDWRGLWKSNVA